MPKDRKEYFKKWKADNKELRRAQKKRYREKYPDKIREQKKLDRLKPKNRINHAIARELTKHLKYNGLSKDGRKWEDLVGYTKEELMLHLQNKFTSEMNWSNYGSYWHIDHIKPRSLFIFTDVSDDQFKQCWALNNLQPLEAKENLIKSNTYSR